MKDLIVKARGTIEKRDYMLPDGMDEVEFGRLIDGGQIRPLDVKISHNTWLTTGWTELLKLITGASSNHFDSTTLIGVGNDATAASAAQTDLLGASTSYKTVSSGYPTTPASGTVQYKARFGTSDANFDHAELVVKNNTSGICWNRDATGWGVKTSSLIRDYTVTLGKA